MSINVVQLTEGAVQHFQKLLAGQQEIVGIRLGVKTTGCSGLSYVLEMTKEIMEQDKVFDAKGISVIVAAKDLVHLQGTIIDWVQDGLNEYVQFKNPNVKGMCGCGESFSVEK